MVRLTQLLTFVIFNHKYVQAIQSVYSRCAVKKAGVLNSMCCQLCMQVSSLCAWKYSQNSGNFSQKPLWSFAGAGVAMGTLSCCAFPGLLKLQALCDTNLGEVSVKRNVQNKTPQTSF